MNERQLDKNAARRLAIIRHAREVTGNVALTCRYYGISRQVFCVWHRRYEAGGPAGLRDRSTQPAHCPHETPAEVVEKIIYLRQNYHFGPVKISRYLKRYHDIEVSKSGVWQILKRLDLNRLPASQRHKRHDRKWKRYEKPMPGHAVQIDVKFIAPLSSPSRKKYRGGTSRWLAGKATWYGVWLQHHGHPARRAGLPQLADRRGNYGLQFPVRRHQQPAATPVPAAVIPADPGRT